MANECWLYNSVSQPEVFEPIIYWLKGSAYLPVLVGLKSLLKTTPILHQFIAFKLQKSFFLKLQKILKSLSPYSLCKQFFSLLLIFVVYSVDWQTWGRLLSPLWLVWSPWPSMVSTAKEDFSPSIVGQFTNRRVLSVRPSGHHFPLANNHSVLRHLLNLDSVPEEVASHTRTTSQEVEVSGSRGEVNDQFCL